MKPAHIALSLVCVAAALTGHVSCEPRPFALQPFTSINICLPFNLLIQPSRDASYAIVVDADPGVLEALNASVANGALTLSTNVIQPDQQAFVAPNATKVAIQ